MSDCIHGVDMEYHCTKCHVALARERDGFSSQVEALTRERDEAREQVARLEAERVEAAGMCKIVWQHLEGHHQFNDAFRAAYNAHRLLSRPHTTDSSWLNEVKAKVLEDVAPWIRCDTPRGIRGGSEPCEECPWCKKRMGIEAKATALRGGDRRANPVKSKGSMPKGETDGR